MWIMFDLGDNANIGNRRFFQKMDWLNKTTRNSKNFYLNFYSNLIGLPKSHLQPTNKEDEIEKAEDRHGYSWGHVCIIGKSLDVLGCDYLTQEVTIHGDNCYLQKWNTTS